MNKKIKFKPFLYFGILILSTMILTSCSSMPKKKMQPVLNFDAEKYLGTWYEIARFDFRWEKDLKNVTANYYMNEDGSIKVVNTGYDISTMKEKQSVGKAKFAGEKNVGALKVSFFWPFYSSYTVIAIDPYYQYSLVAGENTKLMWILSRTPTIPDAVKNDYTRIAQEAGYDLTNLVWTEQD